MQVVIDIPESFYHEINELQSGVDLKAYQSIALIDCIKNGNTLPKGHGRLIDANALIKSTDKEEVHMYEIALAPTIIEADKESEDKEHPVTSKQRLGRWIPISERLPESTDYYLVTVEINEYGLMIPSVRTALYDVKTKDFTVHTGTNMCIVGDVLAWCDCLPEPYKAE